MKRLFLSLCIFSIMIFPVQAQNTAASSQTNSEDTTNTIDRVSSTIQVVSVAVGVVISVLSFTNAQVKEARARRAQAAKPFLDLRQKLYLEAVQAAGVLSNSGDHTSDEIANARKRFRELYVAELSLVEAKGVEASMVELAKVIDPELAQFTPEQAAAYNLAHALRNSLVRSWDLDESIVDNPIR